MGEAGNPATTRGVRRLPEADKYLRDGWMSTQQMKESTIHKVECSVAAGRQGSLTRKKVHRQAVLGLNQAKSEE